MLQQEEVLASTYPGCNNGYYLSVSQVFGYCNKYSFLVENGKGILYKIGL